MPYVIKNNAASTLAAALSAVATSATVQAGAGALFAVTAPDYTYLTLDDGAGTIEVIKLTARAVDVLTIERGLDGTSAVAWDIGDVIECRPCRLALRDAISNAAADIASAATVDLSVATGNIVRITGTTATSAWTINVGQRVVCVAVGAWPLTYHAANNPLPGSVNYTCAAGDLVIVSKDGNGDLHVEIVRRDGTAVSLGSFTLAQLNTAVSDANVAAAGANGDITSLLGLSGNLAFTGTANRITGDFSNATAANRVMFQTTTADAGTFVGALPLGTGAVSSFGAYGGSDPANASFLALTSDAGNTRVESGKSGTGTYRDLSFWTSEADRFKIEAGGNLLVGGTSKRFQADMSNATFASRFAFQNSTVNAMSLLGVLPNGTATSSGLIAYSSSAPDDSSYGALQCSTTLTSITAGKIGTGAYTDLSFLVAGLESLRLNTDGDLLVGNTGTLGANAKMHFKFGGAGTQYGAIWRPAADNTTVQLFQNAAAGTVGSITTTNVATTYNTSSDYRLKEAVAPMTGALARLSQLKPITYTWKVDGSVSEGFLAHELQEVVPLAVHGEKDGDEMQGVDHSKIVPLLVAALQELKAEFDLYKANHP